MRTRNAPVVMAGVAAAALLALVAVGWPLLAPSDTDGLAGRVGAASPPPPAFATPGESPWAVGGAAGPGRPTVPPAGRNPAASPTDTSSAAPGSGSPSPDAGPGESPAAPAEVPIVPVVGFWSTETEISTRELARAVAGRSTDYQQVVVSEGEAPAIATALGVEGGAFETGSPARIRRAVSDGALGLMRLDDVTPQLRALAIDGMSLFGNDGAAGLDAWPLTVAGRPMSEPWREDEAWTLVAGGDVQLDRWMAYHVTSLDKGVDWPWDGGSVRIVGRKCCSDLGHRVPRWELVGDEGAVRDLFATADLALANLEAAAVENARLYTLGRDFRFSLSFSGDPQLLRGLDGAGFDFLSLANNHIHNAGARGIADTIEALDELGIDNAGAGSELPEARRPGRLRAGGQDVVVVPCATVGKMAGPERPGARSCYDSELVDQIADLAEESDVVIVFPHWGREYRAEPSAGQRALARAWARAGADLVLGAHSHWAGAVEEIDGSLVFYSMGNLAFDQPWSEPTMQGLIVELTFQGDELVQAWLHPTLIVHEVQPNLLEPDFGGEKVLQRMRDASVGLFDY